MELFIIVVLVLASIVGMTFIVERGLALRWQKVIPPEVERVVEDFDHGADVKKVLHICDKYPSPLSRLLVSAAEHRAWPKTENADGLQTRARHEVVRLERGLVVLEIVVGIGPLLGLVGTIYGLMILFSGMNQSDLGNHAHVATGIALALRATLLGLLTAIPSLVAWSYFTKKVEAMAVEMESVCDKFLRRLYRRDEPKSSATVPLANAKL